jgi:hypothetical protein
MVRIPRFKTVKEISNLKDVNTQDRVVRPGSSLQQDDLKGMA